MSLKLVDHNVLYNEYRFNFFAGICIPLTHFVLFVFLCLRDVLKIEAFKNWTIILGMILTGNLIFMVTICLASFPAKFD